MTGEFSLPLFPLQTVLFPGGALSLRIFELRYLDLIKRCHKEKAPFGVVCLTQGREVRTTKETKDAPSSGPEFEQEKFHAVGTLALIAEFESPQPGLLMIRCNGGRRFRLRNSEQLRRGLWVGHAQWLEEDVPVPLPPDLVHVGQILQLLQKNLPSKPLGASDRAVTQEEQWNDCGWVANRWCELLPISREMRQQFMALENPLLRLELVADLLVRLKIGSAPQSG
jgi:hypothetical protein